MSSFRRRSTEPDYWGGGRDPGAGLQPTGASVCLNESWVTEGWGNRFINNSVISCY